MKNSDSFSWKAFRSAPIVGIVRGIEPQTVYKIAEAYSKAGLTTLEVTMNTIKVDKIIKNLRREFPQLNIGAGTVCTAKDLTTALDSGAQFIVTPVLIRKVIEKCVKLGIPAFPGAYTPTEIYKAWKWGADAVKVFPATKLGPSYIKDVKAPLNNIKLLPTGGVSKDNIKEYFEAGAYGVGMGSSLLNKEFIAQGNYPALEQHFLAIKNELADFIIGN